jgi:ketosteroid isomerase-like protein
MKKTIAALAMLALTSYAIAQKNTEEHDIRKLEQEERIAMLKRDTIGLSQYWADDFIVNTPANRITHSKRELFELMKSGVFNYTSFTREIEQIFVKGDVIITMGSEVVVPVGSTPKAGQHVKRRFTNIWIKQHGTWKLTARHANEVL